MFFNDLKFGAVLIARDGRRFIFQEYDNLGFMLLKYGPGQDEVSFWSVDGRCVFDDSDFVSDADVIDVESNNLF